MRKISFFLIIFFSSSLAFAIPSFDKNSKNTAPAVLKADEVSGNNAEQKLMATGNVELQKGNSIMNADKVIYDKTTQIINVIGDFKIKDLESGKLFGNNATVKEDFSNGEFFDARMVFNDGSYLKSQKIVRIDSLKSELTKPNYSVCPNPEISKNNSDAGKKRDFFSITSKYTVIDKEDELIKSKHAVFRFYNFPVFYLPKLTVALPSKKAKSGFLTPSYFRASNLGLGVKIPYYFYISPNLDLTTTPLILLDNNQFLIENKLRHKTTYGDYNFNLEFGNNKIESNNDKNVVIRTNKELRWNLKGDGKFDFTLNTGASFKINSVSDRDYLRDYHFDFLNYTLSQGKVDYIKGRDYHSIQLIKIQELEDKDAKSSEPLIIPINSYIETKPMSFGQKFAFGTNFTAISRVDGLQYRRASITPEFNVPYNFYGNLFNLNAKVQGDFYSLDNNFKEKKADNEYDKTATNYKPEASINWSLPLIKKSKSNIFMIEPMFNAVISSYQKEGNLVPNEDSNDTELNISNLFVSDRIAGFDRNESGKRINYGVKTSLFNKYGEFGLNIGQGYKKGDKQDVTIKGFNENNKSNLVGQALYKAAKHFSIAYSFQLDESNYRNEVNQINSTLSFDKVSFAVDYLLVRKNQQNLEEKNQVSLSSRIDLTNQWFLTLANSTDIATSRNLSRSVIFTRDGCCTVFSFAVSETNPSSLAKAQTSYNVNLQFKNL